MYLEIIDKNRAVEFVKSYHYSKIMPRLTKYYLGVFDESNTDELLGVVTLGWGTQPLQTIKKIFYKHNLKTEDYLEIGKMCFLPKCNNSKSFGSTVCSLLVKWIKENTDCLFLYTLADGIMSKCGYVYQASNFQYIGSFMTQIYRDSSTGEKIHPRSAKILLKENAELEGKDKVFWLTHSYCEEKGIDFLKGKMFRYMYPLSKYSKRVLSKYDEYMDLPYPKDDDLVFKKRVSPGKFVDVDKPEFNMNVFNYNYQKGDK